MRKTVLFLAVIVVVIASMLSSAGRHSCGRDAAGLGTGGEGKTLVLNGLGLRTKFVVKVYVAGLYLEQKSSDANAILKADAPKRLVMQFMRDFEQEAVGGRVRRVVQQQFARSEEHNEGRYRPVSGRARAGQRRPADGLHLRPKYGYNRGD